MQSSPISGKVSDSMVLNYPGWKIGTCMITPTMDWMHWSRTVSQHSFVLPRDPYPERCKHLPISTTIPMVCWVSTLKRKVEVKSWIWETQGVYSLSSLLARFSGSRSPCSQKVRCQMAAKPCRLIIDPWFWMQFFGFPCFPSTQTRDNDKKALFRCFDGSTESLMCFPFPRTDLEKHESKLIWSSDTIHNVGGNSFAKGRSKLHLKFDARH